jgi:hypothetical protein
LWFDFDEAMSLSGLVIGDGAAVATLKNVLVIGDW